MLRVLRVLRMVVTKLLVLLITTTMKKTQKGPYIRDSQNPNVECGHGKKSKPLNEKKTKPLKRYMNQKNETPKRKKNETLKSRKIEHPMDSRTHPESPYQVGDPLVE